MKRSTSTTKRLWPPPPSQLAGLRAALEDITPLTASGWRSLEQIAVAHEVARGAHLLRAGARATQVYWVGSGLLREYYVDLQGREFTRRFCDAGELSGSLADLLVERGALVSIQALERSALITFAWSELEALAERETSLLRLMRRGAEALYLRKVEREFEMLTLAAPQRYRRFVAAQPGIESRVPRHMVASYLGITAVHLSRIANGARSQPVRAERTGRKARAR